MAESIARGGFWRSESSLHVAWVDGGVDGGGFRLVISSFDPGTTGLLSQRVFPHVSDDAAYQSVIDASGADGWFAAIIELTVSGVQEPRRYQELIIGRLGGDDPPMVLSPAWPGGGLDPVGAVFNRGMYHIAWDGEAFALHAESGDQTYLMRILPDGATALVPTAVALCDDLTPGYSLTGHAQDLDGEFDVMTDPEDGTSWCVALARNDGLIILSAHGRDGAPLPGPDGPGVLRIPYACPTDDLGDSDCAALRLHIDVRDQEGLIGWSEAGGATHLQSFGPGLRLAGPALVVDHAEPFEIQALTRRAEGRVMVGVSARGIEEVPTDRSRVGEARLVVRDLTPDAVWGPIRALAWGDEAWLGFWDWSDLRENERSPGETVPFRIVRLDDGCGYDSMLTEVLAVCDQFPLGMCAGACRNLWDDEQHCGSCGNECPTDILCGTGTCGGRPRDLLLDVGAIDLGACMPGAAVSGAEPGASCTDPTACRVYCCHCEDGSAYTGSGCGNNVCQPESIVCGDPGWCPD